MFRALVGIFLLCLFPTAFAVGLPPAEAIPGMQGKRVVSVPYVTRGDAGWHLYVFVQDKHTGLIYAPGFSCPHGVCEGWDKFAVRMYALHQAPDPVAAFKKAWAEGISFVCSATVRAEQTDRGRLCREQQQIVARDLGAVEAQLPSVPVWVVPQYRDSPTRPAYPFDGVKRSATKAMDVPHGLTCDCSVRSVEGSTTYCAVVAAGTLGPALLAVCKPVTP